MSSMLTDEPEYWMQLDLLEGCTGYMKAAFENGPISTFDELQREDPESFELFMKPFIQNAKKPAKVRKK